MLYLRDRITEESMRCSIFSRMRHSIDLYAKPYEPRFIEVARSTPNSALVAGDSCRPRTMATVLTSFNLPCWHFEPVQGDECRGYFPATIADEHDLSVQLLCEELDFRFWKKFDL